MRLIEHRRTEGYCDHGVPGSLVGLASSSRGVSDRLVAARVLILTFGTQGDVRPFVALAKGLRAAGHHWVTCTSQNASACRRWCPLPFLTPTRAFPILFIAHSPFGGSANKLSFQFNRFTAVAYCRVINSFRRQTLGWSGMSPE
jgi:hypothetical protein